MEDQTAMAETEPVAPSTPSTLRDDMIARIAPGREERVFLLLSIFIGVVSGLLVVSFRMAIEWLSVLLLGSSPNPHQPRLLYIPAAAGLVIAVLTRYVFPKVRGSGINQTKAALYISNGYISFRTVIGKFLLSALAIGSGHSLGPEDPSLQIGAGVASLISRRFGMSKEKLRIFAPIGAAAGLAAAFNAPISAILFVIEEVIGQWSAAVLGSIVLSAVASVVVARSFWGAQPMFRIPVIDLRDSRELLAYAALGVTGGFASLVFAKALSYLRPKLRSQPQWSQLLQPAAAGLLVGAIGYFGFVQVMGAGYEAIDQAMHAQFAWKMLLLLALFKIIATTLSFSSGTPGGMFAPTLFIGAMLGAAVGTFEKIYFPHLTGSIGSYALVGMGVLFAAFLRAPLTSVFMVLEVSGNYSIVLPVILANTIAYLISRILQPVPILEQFTHQDGLDLPSMEELREESNLHLEDAMQPVTVPILQGSETIPDTLRSLTQYEDLKSIPVFLIHCSDGLWYAAKREELEALTANQPEEQDAATPKPPPATLSEHLGPERTPVLFPDQPLSSALPHFQRWPLLPITNRAMRGSLEGVVSLHDVLTRYQKH
ncbi:chloride channel protein [Tunturiibacter empetritectus]|uniref:CIC family chloride channel protein n=1 Tax=Tunturiibacter lichenicola TaxID=2051959 RepID=A0A852VGF5_9BACT|nr:chloride channel protein [Edaphobacter lichenicola]NYF88526.1 CIC family chloride channel protein [Edaphobacter lichenicola]